MPGRQAMERFVRDEIVKKTGLFQVEIKELKEENQFIKKKLGLFKKRIVALEEAIRERIGKGSGGTDFGV